jgi:hypothetical protein
LTAPFPCAQLLAVALAANGAPAVPMARIGVFSQQE